MAEHPNTAILRRIYARDREAFFAALSDDYVCLEAFWDGCAKLAERKA